MVTNAHKRCIYHLHQIGSGIFLEFGGGGLNGCGLGCTTACAIDVSAAAYSPIGIMISVNGLFVLS